MACEDLVSISSIRTNLKIILTGASDVVSMLIINVFLSHDLTQFSGYGRAEIAPFYFYSVGENVFLNMPPHIANLKFSSCFAFVPYQAYGSFEMVALV